MKKKIALYLLTPLVFGALSYMVIKGEQYSDIVAADTSYTLTINKGISLTDGVGQIRTTQGEELDFAASGYTYSSNNVGTLTTNGEIHNVEKINGIKSISITLNSGSLSLYYGYYGSSSIIYHSEAKGTVTTSATYDLTSVLPTHFKVVANSETVINTISITYSCSPSVTNSNVRLRIANTEVGDGGSISNSNYLWINTDILNKGTWNNYRMSKDANGYYYDFSNVTVQSGYTFSLFISDETESLTEWSYPSDKQNYGFAIYGGQDEFIPEETFTFDDQPTHAVSTYTLNMSITCTTPTNTFGNIQFVYNYTNSTETYTWNTISDAKATSYNYAKADLDASRNIYFKLYIWDSSLGNCYIGDEGGANFVLTPRGESEEDITIDFVYPTAGGNTAGEMENLNSGNPSSSMSFNNVNTTVYGEKVLISPVFDADSETFTASYSGENIRIDNNLYITGLKAGTTTQVTLTSAKGLTCNFNVTVASSTYTATYTRDLLYKDGNPLSETEGWFDSTSVSEISNMGSDFMHGIDISSCKALYDNGTKFYNTSGVEQSLFYILKDNGVNWIRLKLWVDPYTTGGKSYGGGVGDLDNTLWMAYEAKAAGMKVLLDFHYSDYWTHPAQQIVPKAWADANSVPALCTYIKNYTKDTLEDFNDYGCMPDMVQLGNEISSGSFLSLPGSNSESMDNTSFVPGYLYNISGYKSSGDYSLSQNFAYKATAGSSNMNSYLSAGVEAVNEINTQYSKNIKTVVHWAKGGSISSSIINNFYNAITADYDYAGISFYPYYCFDSMSVARSLLNGLNITTCNDGWFVAETSYPYSGWSYVYENSANVTNFTISNWNTGSTNINNEYAFTGSGQARLIHDLTAAVVSAGGKGVFYWEGAWVPNTNVGWAGEGSLNSWANQGFFSLNGKAIANINLFKQMDPHI